MRERTSTYLEKSLLWDVSEIRWMILETKKISSGLPIALEHCPKNHSKIY